MKVLYLDESGTSNLKKVDPQYPIFTLGGVIVDYDDLENNRLLMNEFKTKYWGRTDVILHSNEIVRRKGDFAFLNNVGGKWDEFLKDLNDLMDRLRYRVVVCVIDVPRLCEKYGDSAFDPYEYALRVIIERFIYSMGRYEKGKIFAEARGIPLDKQIKLAFEKIKDTGSGFIQGEEICAKIEKFEVRPKSENLIGLQIADLVLPLIGRNYLGKNNKTDYEIVLRKCLNRDGEVNGNGIIILPRK